MILGEFNMTELTINIPGVRVLRLREWHIDKVIELMNKEGWYYYDHHELKRYLNLNQDCFTLLKVSAITIIHGHVFTINQGII